MELQSHYDQHAIVSLALVNALSREMCLLEELLPPNDIRGMIALWPR
jgi:hypothetical protein